MSKPEIKHTDLPKRLGMRQALDRIIFRARYNWLTALLLPGGCWMCYAIRIGVVIMFGFLIYSTVIAFTS